MDELDEIVTRAVRSRLVSDAPLGAFLSGGIDSSLVVAVMTKLTSAPVKTFTIGFDEKKYDESSRAAEVADYLGTEHRCETMRVDDLTALFPLFRQEFDEPFSDSSAFPVMALSRLTRKHVTVALTGDGADEQFGGYHYYDIAKRLAPFFKIPSTARRALGTALSVIPRHRLKMLGHAFRQIDSGRRLRIREEHQKRLRKPATPRGSRTNQRSPGSLPVRR